MAETADKLRVYNEKRDFGRTAEPRGEPAEVRRAGLQFLVQKHDATRLHYDLRLEWEGVLLSWAITRGPSPDPSEKRLAVRTEDHPMSYGSFEGTIPEDEYGGGTVMLWDRGTWEPLHDPAEGLAEGKLHFRLHGQRMQGGWALVRMRGKRKEKRENWLLIKERDPWAVEEPDALTDAHDTSVKTGRAMAEIAEGVEAVEIAAPAPGAQQDGRRPRFRKLQLATLDDAAPDGDDWWHETKFDGYRCLAALGKGGPVLYTRNGKDWTDRFGQLVPAFGRLDCKSALIDGEVMARTIEGSPFSSLQAALSEGGALVFYAFDLLHLDGRDLEKAPLTERRERLEALFAGQTGKTTLRLTDYVRGKGPQVFDAACRAGAEGIISKKVDAPYRGTRTRSWLKVKCTRRQEFVIGGYAPSDKKGRPFSSLLLGEFRDGKLIYRGRVGTGFKERDFEMLTAAFRQRKTSPFAEVPKAAARGAVWVTPKLVAEVDFAELTADGHIRHGAYLGLRRDKEAEEVTMGHETKSADDAEVAGVRISSPDREIFPTAGLTKLDLAHYYAQVGERMADIIGRYPLSLVRCPQGRQKSCFFQKHPGKTFPASMPRVGIEESDGGVEDYLYVTRAEHLVQAEQMGAIEFHIWGARTDRLDRPDRIVFDLDPDEGLDWADVKAAAVEVRARLADLGLDAGAMVTGGKGVHVWLPLRRSRSWETVKLFTKTFARVMEEADPTRFVANMAKKKRKGRIFIDYLRNERGSTAIAPYSARAREGAPVAVPVTWEELDGLPGANTFSVVNAREWLARDCPYLARMKDVQSLTDATVAALGKMAGK